MPRLEYSTASAAQWRSWVVPLQALCAGTGQQLERLKLELALWVNEGRLEAWGTSKEHLVLHYAVLKQSSDVSRSLVSACETQDIRVHSLDPFDVELFGWTPPEEMYKKAQEAFKEASAASDDFDRLRRMFPGLADCEDKELDIKHNIYLLPALQAVFCGSTLPAIEDCAHELSGAVRLEHIAKGCCGANEPGKRRRVECGEVRWFCKLCGVVWCNSHGLPHRNREKDRWQLEETIQLFKQEPAPAQQWIWYPREPTLQVRSGSHMPMDRKIEWIVFTAPLLVDPFHGYCEYGLPLFYRTYVSLFKQYLDSEGQNLQNLAFACFNRFMRQKHPEYKGVVLKELDVELREEIESITKGYEVTLCLNCKKEHCKCKCRYCGRLGKHQDAECERKKRIAQEWRNPRCRHCPYEGQLEKVMLDAMRTFSPLLPPAPPHIAQLQSYIALDNYVRRCRERNEPCLLVGWEEGAWKRSYVPPTELVPPLPIEDTLVSCLRCPECRTTWRPPSAYVPLPEPGSASSAGSARGSA